jgi:hypothetical protein
MRALAAVLRFVFESGSARALTRREWLQIGGLGGLGLTLPVPGIPARAGAASTGPPLSGFGRARSVILVFASGGQSQLETWDPKPDAPEEIRGAFGSIATGVPGTRLCEYLPQLARLAPLYTLVRSVCHDDRDHGSAAYLALTGQFHPRKSSNPPPRPTDFPTYGAVLQRVRPTKRFPYTAVHVNGPALVPEIVAPGQFGGLLGRAYEPLTLGGVAQAPVAIDGLEPQPELPPVRQSARRTLLESIDRYRGQLHPDRALGEMDLLYRQAYELLAAPHCREAFDLTREPASLRERYGRHRSGQACLLARRLVEAGVPLVTVIWNHTNRGQDKTPDQTETYGWDTHNDIFEALKVHLLPRFDQSFSALLEDLERRGLLQQTLVVCMGEFGRAPRVALEPSFAGRSPGRKHWPSVYSVVLAGAGVARGGVVGASDRIAAYPMSNPVSPADLAATMFAALGVDPSGHYTDPGGRPFPITTGQPIRALYG